MVGAKGLSVAERYAVATVFDVFAETPYTFLEISRGNVYGDRIVSQRLLSGVFKLKTGMTSNNDMEVTDADATLHAHPEDFNIPTSSLVGQGVQVDGVNYTIDGVSEGKNFASGVVEHIYMRLQKTDFVGESYGR